MSRGVLDVSDGQNPAEMYDSLKAVPFFAELSDEDLGRVCEHARAVEFAGGTRLFAEGDPGDVAYVIMEGEVEILKVSSEREVLLAVRGPGEVIGEMALLQEAPRIATARARDTVSLITIPKAALDDLLASSASAARALFAILLQRWQDTEVQLRQSERMAQLGTLAAGLAHELNNPAAAVGRGADQLLELVDDYGAARAAMGVAPADASAQPMMIMLLDRATGGRYPELDEDPLARGDREEEIAAWVSAHGVPDPWQVAHSLADLQVSDADLDGLFGEVEPDRLPHALQLVRASYEVSRLLQEMTTGAARVSAIVGALKSYTYLDQAPVQEIEITAGIDDTLLLLGSTIAGISVRREYDPQLPRIEAHGSELNQVWTNLITNAADAIGEAQREDGELIVRAFPDGDLAVVEFEDNGAGIPSAIQHRVFDRFFTTKPPGSGSGLGLDLSFRIVVNEHGGSLRLIQSEPGRTVFRVELPLHRRIE